MQVRTATLKGLVQGEKQFQVPIWQRQYTWKPEQHRQLWRDVVEQYRSLGSGLQAAAGHFLGSFVLSPKDPTASGVSYFLVIDGQQRLTTLMLLLCALRDRASQHDEQAVARYDENYLIQQVPPGRGEVQAAAYGGGSPSVATVGEPRTGQRRWGRHISGLSFLCQAAD